MKYQVPDPSENPTRRRLHTVHSWLRRHHTLTFWGVIAVVCGALALAIYHVALNTPLTSDARFLGHENTYVRDPVGFLRFWTADFFEGAITNSVPYRSGYYRPITNVLFWIEYRWAGGQALPYILSEVLLHAANGVLVALLCLRLSGNRFAAALAGVIFVVHPVHANAATDAAARSDVVFSIFYILAILAFDSALRATNRRRIVAFVALTVVLYLAAVLSKEMGVTLPAVLVLVVLLYHYRDRASLRLMWRVVPVWGALAMYVWWRFGVIQATPLSLGYTETHHASVLALAGIKGLTIQLSRIVLPLGPTYPELNPRMVNFVADAWSDPLTYAAMGVLAGVIIIATLWRQRPTVAFWSGFFLITYAPLFKVDTIVSSTGMSIFLAEERWIYLPSMAVISLLSLGLARFASGRSNRAVPLATGAAVVACSIVLAISARAHISRHDDPHARLRRLYLLPEERLTRIERANKLLLYAQWVAAPLGHMEDAERRAREAVALVPDSPIPATVLASVLGQAEKWDEAVAVLTPWSSLTGEELFRYAQTNGRVGDDLNRVRPTLLFVFGVANVNTGDRSGGLSLLCESWRRGFDSVRVAKALDDLDAAEAERCWPDSAAQTLR